MTITESINYGNIFLITANLPVFVRNPSDLIIYNYQTAIFECFVKGSSSITVKWEKDRKAFSPSNKIVTTHKTDNGVISNLTLERATVNDGGKYRCKATNDDKSAVSVEAELISKYL